MVDRAKMREAIGMSNKEINECIKAAPIRTVPIDQLVTPQRTVRPEHVQHYLDDPDAEPEDKGLVPVDHPIVIRKGGTSYLWDGNHRTSAAKLSGASQIQARVVDLDAHR